MFLIHSLFNVLLHVLILLTLSARAFDFSFSSPTSCDPLSLSWSGGSAPFQLLITPLFYVPINITIPDSAVDPISGNASYTFQQLNFTAGQKFLLTMSDATGFNAGGTSDVLQVGSSTTGASCNTTEPNSDFIFELNTALQQCRSFTFSDFDNATQPVRILGLIPLGQAFELDPPEGPTSFNWTANVESGTSIAFIMTDAEGRRGGSSDIKLVGESDDSSCIDSSSPHSTISASSSQTGQATATQTVAASGSGNATGAIVGGVLGGLSFLVVSILLALCCLRRRRKKKAAALAYDDDDHIGSGSMMRERDPGRPPPTAVIGVGSNSHTSRISRVRSSLIPASRFRRQNRSFDLLPGTAARQSRAANNASDTGSPRNENYYLPSPYVLPSSIGAADGHSVAGPPPEEGAYAYEPQTPTYTSSASRTHSRTHSRSHSGDTHANGYGQGYGVGLASPTSPVSAGAFNSTSHRSSGRRSSKNGGGHARRGSHPISVTSASKAAEAGAGLALVGSRRSQQRFILHRDAEDLPSDAEDGAQDIVELPPQYSDRRSASLGRVQDRERRVGTADGLSEGDRLETQDSVRNTGTTTTTTSTTGMTTTGTNEGDGEESKEKEVYSPSSGSNEEYAAPRLK